MKARVNSLLLRHEGSARQRTLSYFQTAPLSKQCTDIVPRTAFLTASHLKSSLRCPRPQSLSLSWWHIHMSSSPLTSSVWIDRWNIHRAAASATRRPNIHSTSSTCPRRHIHSTSSCTAERRHVHVSTGAGRRWWWHIYVSRYMWRYVDTPPSTGLI